MYPDAECRQGLISRLDQSRNDIMFGTILIPQINSTLKDERFLAIFNDISTLSNEVLWSFEQDTLQSHLQKFDNNLRKYPWTPEFPRYQILQDLTCFFTYVLAHIPQYPSGGYYELLVDWIYSTPEIFGHAQEMRFQYAVQTWYSVFTSYGKGFMADHNTLLILAANLITQPARFTALICYMLANKVNITVLMESQVLQDFFAYYAGELLQDENPIAYFYHTLLSISKKQTQGIPNINQTLIEGIENLLFDVGNTYDIENTGVENIMPQLIALTQRFPHLETKSTSLSIRRPSHLNMSEGQINNYFCCFGLDWIAPALGSVLSHHRVDMFLTIALSYQAPPSFLRLNISNTIKRLLPYNQILSYLIQQALTMDLDQSVTFMGRLALTLNPMSRFVLIERYPELLFLLILNPNFCFLSDNFLVQTGTAINSQYWEERISFASKKVFLIRGIFTNTRLYLLTKLLMLIETTKNPDGTLFFAHQFTQQFHINLIRYISTCTGFEIDINRVNSTSFYPGAQNIAANNVNSILIALCQYIKKRNFNAAHVYEHWLSHPEKLMLFSFLLTGRHHFQRFSPRNIVNSFLLLPKWGYQTETPNIKNLIETLHDFSDNEPDQLETLMLALLHTLISDKQTSIILYLSQKYSEQGLLDIFLNVDPNFLYQIIDMKNVMLLKKIVSLPMRVELKTQLFLYILDKIEHKKKTSSIAQQENIHCLQVFLTNIKLSEEAEFALLFFIIQHDCSELATLCHSEQYIIDPSTFSLVFKKMAELKKFDCLSNFPKYFESCYLDHTIVSTVFNDIAAKEKLDLLQHYFGVFRALLPFQAIGDAFLMAGHANNWSVYAFLYETLQNLEPSYPSEDKALHYLKKAITAAYPQVHVLKKLLVLKRSDEELKANLVDHLKQSIRDGIVDVFLYLKEHLSEQCSNAEKDEWKTLAEEYPHENIYAVVHHPRSPPERSASECRLSRNISTSSLPTPKERSRTPSPHFWKTPRDSELIEPPLDVISDGFVLY